MKLSKITIQTMCSMITTGATNSTYEEAEGHKSTYKLLPGYALDQQGGIDISMLKPVSIRNDRDCSRFVAQQGDVVVLAKGNAIRTAYITKEVAEQNVIISANFILLRPHPNQALGESIVAYFSTSQGRVALESLNRGSVIKSVNASSLKALEIPLPSLEEQQQIADLFQASNDAYQKAMQLAEQDKKAALACINTVFSSGENK